MIWDRTHRSASGTIGNVLEWYDFAVFGYMAPLMSGQFFPDSDENAALLKTFGVFAVGYFARPLGGVLFGQIGDRRGRKRALQLSVATMAIPTSLIMALPTYTQVGLLSPILLIACGEKSQPIFIRCPTHDLRSVCLTDFSSLFWRCFCLILLFLPRSAPRLSPNSILNVP